MRTGKSNNSDLAGQLDSLSMPTGSAFKKEAAWEKLQKRLGHKKRNRKKAVLIAILSIPIAASLVYFVLRTGYDPKVEEKKQTMDIPRAKPNPVVETKTRKIENLASKEVPAHHVTSRTEVSLIKPNDHAQTVITDSLVASVVPDTSATNTVAIAPVIKKKLKVVHNNELGDPLIGRQSERSAMANNKPGFLQGLRRSPVASYEEISDDTVIKQKSKRSLLPFSSLISQKE
jgi:hypothetical protein